MTQRRIRQRSATETTTDPSRRTWRFEPRFHYEVPLSGPWDHEPDKIQWVDTATDLDCLMVRNHFGVWCGYVGVPRSHPLYRIPYDVLHFQVHGGLTFADLCQPGEPIDGICHIAEPGREDRPWWFGFDCGHAWDFAPGLMVPDFDLRDAGTVYRDEGWVTTEVRQLAEQLKAVA